MNIYFVEDATAGGRATGFLFNTVTDFPTVTVARNAGSVNVFNTLVLAHEVGHCLGLLHTHETAFCTENIPRTNCTMCGDELCDTPADPNLNISTANVNDATCLYVGGQTQNGVPYTPDTRNVMSYTLPHCMLGFTQGQGNRMRNFILNTNTFDDFVIPFNRNIIGTFSNVDRYFSVENDIQSTAIISDGNLIFEAGNSIVLNPGFETDDNVMFEARIQQYSCNTPLVNNAAKKENENSNPRSKSGKSSFSLYPNPATSSFNLTVNIQQTNPVEVSLWDIAGRMVKIILKMNPIGTGEHNFTVNTEGLSSGVYFANLIYGDKNETQRIIISN